jgi:uncharacterized membrane protein YedE/YeeE
MGPIVPTEFTPWAALGGGVLIGLSAVLVMALFGRIAGIAGISSGVLGASGAPGDRGWRVAFVLGLGAAPLVYSFAGGTIEHAVPENLSAMAVAGLLVGVGTGIGSGCTSGHGVCGVARLSRRSFAAVATFVAAGVATVYVLRHLVGGW